MIEMPRHADFDKIYDKFIDLYGEEKGKTYYYSWLNKYGLDDTKPYDSQEQGLLESFSWIPIKLLREAEGGKFWKVWAISRGTSMNDNPYEKNLDRAARSLENRTVNINHVPEYTLSYGWPDKPTTARTVAAEYEDKYVEVVIWVGDEVAYPGPEKAYRDKTVNQMLVDEDILHPSIEAVPRFPEPFEYDGDPSFTGIALLTREYLPGDPVTRIEPLVERMMLSSTMLHGQPPPWEALTKGGKNMKEQEDDVERAKKHYDLTDEEWSALASEIQAKLIKALPPPSDDGDSLDEYDKAPEEEDWDYDESKYTQEQLSHASAVIVTEDGEVHNPGYVGEDLTKAACKLPHHRPGNGTSHGGTLVWRGVSAAGAAGVVIYVSDTGLLSDAIYRDKVNEILDSLGLTDLVYRGKDFAILDSLGLADLIDRIRGIRLTEDLTLSDNLLTDKALLTSDTGFLSDSLLL